MKSNKKQGIYEISLAVSKTVLFVLLAFCGFVFYGLIKRGDIIQSEPVNFVENWDVAYSENGDQTLTTTLPEDVKANEYLLVFRSFISQESYRFIICAIPQMWCWLFWQFPPATVEYE